MASSTKKALFLFLMLTVTFLIEAKKHGMGIFGGHGGHGHFSGFGSPFGNVDPSVLMAAGILGLLFLRNRAGLGSLRHHHEPRYLPPALPPPRHIYRMPPPSFMAPVHGLSPFGMTAHQGLIAAQFPHELGLISGGLAGYSPSLEGLQVEGHLGLESGLNGLNGLSFT